MTNKDLMDNKKILIYLYHQFNGDNGKIITELMENNLKANMETVNKYIKENNLKLSEYKCMWEKKFPTRYKDDVNPTMIIHIKDIKSAKKVYNQFLETENAQFKGMTVREFIEACDIDKNISLSQLNELLKENDIKPFN